jgi:hypothetical protein
MSAPTEKREEAMIESKQPQTIRRILAAIGVGVLTGFCLMVVGGISTFFLLMYTGGADHMVELIMIAGIYLGLFGFVFGIGYMAWLPAPQRSKLRTALIVIPAVVMAVPALYVVISLIVILLLN